MNLCESIETLSMAYLDDELAAEERRELELHLTECTACRGHLDDERSDHELLHRALAAPPAPDLLRAKITRALDAEDAAATREVRKRWTRWLLPGSAITAAAAAILVFVGMQIPASQKGTAVVDEAMRQQIRPLPMEVQGPQTVQWLKDNANVEPPQVGVPSSRLLGGRLLPGGVNGHDAELLQWQLSLDGQPFVLSMVRIHDVRDGELGEGQEIEVNGRTMHVVEEEGRVAVTFVDADHVGYAFMAPELSANDLVGVVARSRVR
jgi:hypothetical protein